MLYLQNTRDPQAVSVPRSCKLSQGQVTFQARSTVDLDTVIDLQVLNLNLSRLYVDIAVIVPEESPVGEYEYILSVDGEVQTTGLLQIGDFGKAGQYEKTITYEQYESTE